MIQIKNLPASNNNVLAVKCNNCGKSVLRVSPNIFNMRYTLWYEYPLCNNQMETSGYDFKDIAVPSNEIPVEYIGKSKRTDKRVRIDFSNLTNIFTVEEIASANKKQVDSALQKIMQLHFYFSDIKLEPSVALYISCQDTQWIIKKILKLLEKNKLKENVDWVWMPNSLSLDSPNSFLLWLIKHKNFPIILVNNDTNIMVDHNADGVLGRKDFYSSWKKILNSGRVRDERVINISDDPLLYDIDVLPVGEHYFTSKFIFISKEPSSSKFFGNEAACRYSSLNARIHDISPEIEACEVFSLLADEFTKGRYTVNFATNEDISKLFTLLLYVLNDFSNKSVDSLNRITFSMFDILLDSLEKYKKNEKSFNDFFRNCFCKELNIVAVKYSL